MPIQSLSLVEFLKKSQSLRVCALCCDIGWRRWGAFGDQVRYQLGAIGLASFDNLGP